MNLYEQKYKEALERLKSFKEKYYTKDTNFGDVIFDKTGEMQKDFESIFPELAESEDERIRRGLLDIFKQSQNGYWAGMEIKDIVAWLEKQKEQKPDSLIYDKDLDKAAREFYLSGGADSPVDSTGLVPIVRMAEFGATWMKDRMEKEQKPEWSVEDELMMKAVIGILDENDHPKLCHWLKSLRPSWKPSEEQMEAFKKYIEEFQARAEAAVGGWNNFDVMIRLYEQLKKL